MRMRIAQIQGVTVAEEMGRTRTLGACWSDTWKVDIEGGYHCTTLNTNSVLLSEHDWTEHVDNAPGNHRVTFCVYEFDYFRYLT
ncbi:uncharacterized protein LOC144308451 isoform X7 [Canis aureus]